jgi:alkanesulfonate monooxygenase SsuD/methylene tetrahydromethanopterin reductase-like flavin-dependent oxidoreductase (luciferase family)
MHFDVFFSICQTDVNGALPSERTMFENFFAQVQAADDLGYGTAWLAESHLSCEVQKRGASPVIPNFRGEIGLNTDVLLTASKVFQKTKRIEVGSAIRSILVNGGPIAHAEAVKSFLTLHGLDTSESRKLHLGFAAGRFKFSTEPYGIFPRNNWENAAWPVIKSKIFLEATEIFLRLLRGEELSSTDLQPQSVSARDFFGDKGVPAANQKGVWQRILDLAKEDLANFVTVPQTSAEARALDIAIVLPPRWPFARLGVIPQHPRMDLLRLLIGSHDPVAQELANRYLPCGVFNLSITPGSEIEKTHARMQTAYHPGAGDWNRSLMPRTVLIFVDATPGLSPEAQREKAKQHARAALQTYWHALEGTLDERRINGAVDNALVGNPMDIALQIHERFHPDDRLMLWFDFFNHDSAAVIRSMEVFQTQVVPLIRQQQG